MTTLASNLECAVCVGPKKIGKYLQGETIVCELCFTDQLPMTCLSCMRIRKRVTSVFLMSCPCYDNDLSDDDVDESMSDHTSMEHFSDGESD